MKISYTNNSYDIEVMSNDLNKNQFYEMLNDPISSSGGSLDDGVSTYINLSKGWDKAFMISSEAIAGFYFGSIKNDTSYTFSRMYYYQGVQPNVLYAFRQNVDMYIQNFKVSYDENYIIADMVYNPLGSQGTNYNVFIVISKDLSAKLYVKSNYSFNMLYGLKPNDSSGKNWSPQQISVSPNIQYYIYINTNTITVESINKIAENYNRVIKNYNYISNKDNINIFSANIKSYSVLNEYFNHRFFFEGKESLEDIYIKDTNSERCYKIKPSGNYYIGDFNIFGNYIALLKDSKYEFNIKSKNLIRGFITGSVDISLCDINSSGLYIECYRDNKFISKTSLNEILEYRLDNLIYNEKYVIVLVDSNMILERKVLSNIIAGKYYNESLKVYDNKISVSTESNHLYTTFNISYPTDNNYILKLYYGTSENSMNTFKDIDGFSTQFYNKTESYFFKVVDVVNNIESDIIEINPRKDLNNLELINETN